MVNANHASSNWALVLLERKALIKPLMMNKIICQLEIRVWLSYRGQQKTLANYHIKCHGRFLFNVLFFKYPWIINMGKVKSHTLTQFPAINTLLYLGKRDLTRFDLAFVMEELPRPVLVSLGQCSMKLSEEPR